MALRISSLNHRLTTNRSDANDDLHVRDRRWFAVRTAARHEKRAAGELAKAGIECFVPLREKVYYYTSKQVTRQLPLLTGYAFVRIHKGEEATVVRATYVAGFVRIGHIRRQVTEEELGLLRTLSADRDLDWETVEEAFDFQQGTPVEIIKGPLVGIRGYYQSKKNKKTFVISLGGLGACLSTCEVDPTYLVTLSGEPLEGEEGRTEKSLW